MEIKVKDKNNHWGWMIAGFALVIALVAVRLAAPTIILKQINQMLDESEEYAGHVEDIDLHILRGIVVAKTSASIMMLKSFKFHFLEENPYGFPLICYHFFSGKIQGRAEIDDWKRSQKRFYTRF